MGCPMTPIEHAGMARQQGFSYLVLLLWIVIGGVLLTALSSQWLLDARREREIELVFRAEQYLSLIHI